MLYSSSCLDDSPIRKVSSGSGQFRLDSAARPLSCAQCESSSRQRLRRASFGGTDAASSETECSFRRDFSSRSIRSSLRRGFGSLATLLTPRLSQKKRTPSRLSLPLVTAAKRTHARNLSADARLFSDFSAFDQSPTAEPEGHATRQIIGASPVLPDCHFVDSPCYVFESSSQTGSTWSSGIYSSARTRPFMQLSRDSLRESKDSLLDSPQSEISEPFASTDSLLSPTTARSQTPELSWNDSISSNAQMSWKDSERDDEIWFERQRDDLTFTGTTPITTTVAPATCRAAANEARYPDELDDASEFPDLAHLAAQNVLTCRHRLKTGRLLLRSGSFALCLGVLRAPNRRYPARNIPVSIIIHRGVNCQEEQQLLLEQVERARHLQHEHLLTIIGAICDGAPSTPDGGEVLVACERTHARGTLCRLLRWSRQNNEQLMSEGVVLTLCLQLCSALIHLHEHRVTLRCVRTASIALDRRCRVKLSAVEERLSRHDETRWQSLEVLAGAGHSQSSLVWSFGVVLWESLSLGATPYSHLSSDRQVADYVTRGKRLIRPELCQPELYPVLRACWLERASQRPDWYALYDVISIHQIERTHAHRKLAELFPHSHDFLEDRYL